MKSLQKNKDSYSDIEKNVETRFETSNYQLHRPFPKGKNQKVFGLVKDESAGTIMKQSAALRAKKYSFLTDNLDKDKKDKGTKKCVVKRKVKFQDYKHCLEATQLENKINHLEKK